MRGVAVQFVASAKPPVRRIWQAHINSWWARGGLATFSGGIGWRRGFGGAPTTQPGFLGGSPFDIAATPAAADSQDLDLAAAGAPSYARRAESGERF